MAYHGPKKAIVEFLSNPPDKHVKVMREQGFIAKAPTIQFLKERHIPHHQLHAVTYESEAGQLRNCICFVNQDESGLWDLSEAAHEGLLHPPTKQERDTSQPWVSLGGRYTPFWAAGHVIDHGFDVIQVSLISNNGLVFEDQVEHGLVLFLTDQHVQWPVEAKLYNRSGMLVSTQTAFPAIPPEWGKP